MYQVISLIHPIFHIISFGAILVGSITDLKTREVPDWLNYFLIASALSLNFLLSILKNNFTFIFESIAGLGIAFSLSALLFYTGQWGGGDAKLLMGIGAALGISIKNSFIIYPIILSFIGILITINYDELEKKAHKFFKEKISKTILTTISIILAITSLIAYLLFIKLDSFLIIFIVNLAIAGGIYGTIWSFVMAIKNWKKIKKEISVKRSFFWIAIPFILSSFFVPKYLIPLVLVIAALILMLPYLLSFVRAIEGICMIKTIPIEKLTEGDWIVDEVKIGKKIIVGPKDLGITLEQIVKLKQYSKDGKIKKVTIKEGIPFVPSFFFAYILTILSYNALILLF